MLLFWLFPGRGQSQVYTITGRTSCETCAITLAERLALGAQNDPEVLGGMVRAALGSGGQLYLISDLLPGSGVLAYSPDGRFQNLVGRQGRGPGEFTRAWRIATSSSGELYVHDTSSEVHVFGPDGAFRRVLRGPVLPVIDPVVLGDSIVAIGSGAARPRNVPDREILLYRTDTGALIGGAGPPVDLRPGQPGYPAAFFRSGEDAIWVLGRGSNVLERWSLGGALQIRLNWHTDWHAFVPGAYRGHGATIGRIWEDTRNRLLWVKSQVRNPGYHDPFPQIIPGQPYPTGYFDPRQMNGRYNSVITVVDLDSGAVVAHLPMDEYVYQFLDDGRLITMQESADGYQWVEVLTLRLTGFRR